MALPIPKRRVCAIFVTTKIDGETVHVRENFNVVIVDRQDGQGLKTYLEPAGHLLISPSPDDNASRADASAHAEIYHEIRYYDVPPYNKSRMGILGV